jgi:hypothetical protein
MAVLQPHDITLSDVHPGRAGTILKTCDASRQEVMQHHHCRHAMTLQVLDPLDHKPKGHVQPRGLLPSGLLGCQGLGWEHQAFMDMGPYNHPVFPPAIPPARAHGRNVRDWTLGLDLEVVGADQVRVLPRPSQHVDVIPRSEIAGMKPPYMCQGCSNHTYSNNMIT